MYCFVNHLFLVLVSRGSMAGINILSSALFSILMMSFALYLQQRALMTNADNENEVFSYYMDVWKVFIAQTTILTSPLLSESSPQAQVTKKSHMLSAPFNLAAC